MASNWQNLIRKPWPPDSPVTIDTLVANLEWNARQGRITPEYAEREIRRLRREQKEDSRRNSYNPFARLYQAAVDLKRRIFGGDREYNI